MGRRRKSTLSRIANAEAARSAKAPKQQESPEAESNLLREMTQDQTIR